MCDNLPHAFDGIAPQAECICATFSAIECICASECMCAAVPPADPHTPASHAVHVLTTTFQAVNMLGRFSVSSWSCAATPEQCLIKRRDCSYLTQEDCGAGPFFSVSVAHPHTHLQVKSDRWSNSHAECQFQNHSVIRYPDGPLLRVCVCGIMCCIICCLLPHLRHHVLPLVLHVATRALHSFVS